MADQSIHINYSFDDIQRYLQGKMSAAEMHNIEKAALQDPFLADAIEGYNEVDAGIAQQHLNEINAGLFAQEKSSKIIALSRKTGWLRIAAMIIVIAGIGILVSSLFRSSNNKQQQVAQLKKEAGDSQKNKEPVFEKLNESPPLTDTVAFIAQTKKTKKLSNPEKKPATGSIISENEDLQNNESPITVMNALTDSAQQHETTSRTFANADAVNPKADSDSLQRLLRGRAAGINISSNTFSGKVIDENNKPVAGAVVESDDKKTAVVTDLNGDFSLRKNDSLLSVTASTIGYERAQANLQSGYSDTIVLKQSNTALNEVVVVGYGSAKTKTSNKAALPVGGWENFNNYVLGQINKDSSNANFMSNEDIVEIEFLIDKAGNPYEFKILKSLDDQHNAKAIEILKSGPKWTNYSKNSKARISIAF